MGGVATPVKISGQSKLFRDNQSYSGTIWAKADFRDPSGTQVKYSGLSRRFRDSWQLCCSYHRGNVVMNLGIGIAYYRKNWN